MDYFEQYKEAKKCLFQMIGQFYDYYLPREVADEFNIIYDKKDVKEDNHVEVLFHNYQTDGLIAWQLLNIKNKFITHDDLWNKRSNIRYENRKDIDYQDMYYRMSILLADMVIKYYGKTITIEDAKRLNIKYNDYYDEDDNSIKVCDHMYESAGEQTWKLFGIKNPIVGESMFYGIRDYNKNQLIIKESAKIKEYKKLRR